jgi:hypothetical protein
MNFDEAEKTLTVGKRSRRTTWQPEHTFIKKAANGSTVIVGLPANPAEHAYVPTAEEKVAKDWEEAT